MTVLLPQIRDSTDKTAWGVLLGILGGGVPPDSPKPDPISDQKKYFSAAVIRPDL